MKIVHLTSVHPRYDQRILWRECFSLKKHGYDVTLIVNDTQPNEVLENGIKILSTGYLPKTRWQRMTEGVDRVWGLGMKENADLYHLHDPELLRIALKLKKNGKKVIFDSHEIYKELIKDKKWIPFILRKPLASIYNLFETYICRRIDGVVCVDKYDGKDWFLGRSKQFVNVGNFPPNSEFENVKIPPYSERKGICYSGRISKQRGALRMLHAAKLADARLVLAGQFESDEFYQEFLRHDTNDTSRYQGMLNRKEIFELYAKCAVGLCVDTSGQATKLGYFNTKIYEYMAMELPVILSDWPYRRCMIEKYRFGLLADPNNPNDIAEKIKWLLTHPKEAEQMGKNGKCLLKKQFLWEVSERELLKIYKNI